MNLTDLDRMYAEATQGEWHWDDTAGPERTLLYADGDKYVIKEWAAYADDSGLEVSDADKALIVALHNAYPSLAARIRELEARCAEQEAKIEAARAIIERVDGQCEERIREAQEVYMKILEGHDP